MVGMSSYFINHCGASLSEQIRGLAVFPRPSGFAGESCPESLGAAPYELAPPLSSAIEICACVPVTSKKKVQQSSDVRGVLTENCST